MLFPPLIRQEMLPEESYPLNNGESIQLRIADESDLEDIILIQEACYQGKAPWGRMAVNNELRNKHTAFFLMAHTAQAAVAFIGISKRNDSLHVTNIATIPTYQKQGIATFLIQTVMDLAKQLKRRRITLEVRMSNETAKSLYRKLGFRDGRIKRNYYHSDGEDALDMIYLLDENEMGEYNEPQSFK